MLIQSNNPIVKECIAEIATIARAHGGEIHPNLVVNHLAERLWLSCPRSNEGETLLRIPHALFIPVSRLQWSCDGGILTYSGDTSTLTAVQKQILDVMVTLYNTTDKINQVAAQFPDTLFRQDLDLYSLIQKARPQYVLSDKSLAEQFISTRLSTQNNEDTDETTEYIMPLIDMLNHHPYAPKYGRNEAKDWIIPLQHPKSDSEECFVRYQKGDSLANALWHGYFESAPNYLSSVQCSFTHESLGTVTIYGVNYERRKLNAPFVKRVECGLDLYSIILDPETLPALRTFLGLAVRSANRLIDQQEAELMADGLIDSILALNKAYFLELSTFCAIHQNDYPLRALFADVANHQLTLLHALRSE